jgi:hypothetical protein
MPSPVPARRSATINRTIGEHLIVEPTIFIWKIEILQLKTTRIIWVVALIVASALALHVARAQQVGVKRM